MFGRPRVCHCLGAVLLTGLLFPLSSCSNSPSLTSIAVTPTNESGSAGATWKFTAIGSYTHPGHPAKTQDITQDVTWKSGSPQLVSITNDPGHADNGAATVVGNAAGTTQITATLSGFNGIIVGTASVTVTASGNGAGASTSGLLSINIVPGGTTVSNKGMTGQYLAFGTYSTPPLVRDLTNQVTWISLSPEVVSINSGGVSGEVGGLATAMGYTGNGVIYAEMTNPVDGSVILSNSETFTCKDPTTLECEQDVAHPQFATLTIYNAGENTTSWLVTAPSDTGTPNLIHCGPGWTGTGGSVCTGTYETGSTVVVTSNITGSGFGGWSSGDGFQVLPDVGCQTAAGTTLLNSPTCTITLYGNTSIGAIFY